MSDSPFQDIAKKVHEEKLLILFQQNIRGLIVSFLVALIFVVVMYHATANSTLIVWLLVMLSLLGLRYLLSLIFLRDYHANVDHGYWLVFFSAGVFLTGLLWGLSVPLFFHEHAAYQVITSIIVIAMIAAGGLYLSVFPGVYLLYVAAAAGPFCFTMIALGAPYNIIGFVLFPFSYFLWLSAKSFSMTFTANLELRLQNESLARRLVLAKNEVEKHSRAKTDFLSQMSHEFRTPLNAIMGFAQLINAKKQFSRAEIEDSTREILKAGDYLLNLVNELLEISAIEKGKVNLYLQNCRLGSLIYRVTDLLLPIAEAKNIVIKVKGDEGWQDLSIVTDEKRFTQVLVNLLSNAIKYNRSNGEVELVIELLSDEKYRIVVKDTGIGIPAQDQHKIFTRYNKINLDPSIPGTGLGLSIVRDLVESMGGTIQFFSMEGEGSKFWFQFPVELQYS